MGAWVEILKYTYRTKGTCSSKIILELDGDTVVSVRFVDGCDGNTKGVAALVRGMKADEVIRRCRGITCGFKPTSCPDQLAAALVEARERQKAAAVKK